MYKAQIERWKKAVEEKGKYPTYKLLADLIEQDIETGKLQPQDKIPPMRDLAEIVGINYSTASRAYAEARKRGLIESITGAGTFAKGKVPAIKPSLAPYELTMNMVIEPAIPTLVDEIKDVAISTISQGSLYKMLRYQEHGGSTLTKELVKQHLLRKADHISLSQLVISQGVHQILSALVTQLCDEQQVICVDSLTYPGIKSIAAQLGKRLHALERDHDGPLVSSFEDACKTHQVAALYLNPTMHNPTCTSISRSRREALVDVALRYSINIIEDDVYEPLAENPAPSFAQLAPELTYYVSSLSKCFGPGVRFGFVACPTRRAAEHTNGALRSLNVMSVPIMEMIVSNWLREGTVDRMIQSIRREANARQQIIYDQLHGIALNMEENAFHFWLKFPKTVSWHPTELAIELRSKGISSVASVAFATDNHPPHAMRVCFGGPFNRSDVTEQMQRLKETLFEPPHLNQTRY
ncbi:PLP-dependent aminotransferase family protein [Rhodanobacter aciditrophus]|uniref:PLP-dependent aminotransferase family protein n=1 Tax=Rhodanobacter aciditrophus TaxID=1623218 RepID=A0ABW4B1Z5_9GAMM